MKQKGNILIEVIASIMILTLTTTFIISTAIQNNNMLKRRILLEEVNRSMCNLANEFKYNMKRTKIEELLRDGEISFKYNKDFANQLLNKDINNLERGTDIKVNKVGENSIGLKLKIEANISCDNNSIIVENEFTKSWWMDETEKVY